MSLAPALYLSHGAPPLVDDPWWPDQLRSWTSQLNIPRAILVVSAHWESAPLTIGATDGRTPLFYDFYGFPQKYYTVQYQTPNAQWLADRVAALIPDGEDIAHQPNRGLDHGAYVPLTVMYPKGEIPVLQISMPTLDPQRLFDLGRRLGVLRAEGVMIMASGFTTHGLPFIDFSDPHGAAPSWSMDFDQWMNEALGRSDIDTLMDFQHKAPGMPYAHPTTEHFAPLFVALGASSEESGDTHVDGYWYGLSKRSIQFA